MRHRSQNKYPYILKGTLQISDEIWYIVEQVILTTKICIISQSGYCFMEKKQKKSKVRTSDQLKRVIISRLRSVNVSVFPDWDPWMCHFSRLRSLKVSLSQSGITDTFRDLDLEKWHISGSQSGKMTLLGISIWK